MSTGMSEIKTALNGANSGLEIGKGKISELYAVIKTTPN